MVSHFEYDWKSSMIYCTVRFTTNSDMINRIWHYMSVMTDDKKKSVAYVIPNGDSRDVRIVTQDNIKIRQYC